ncbi:MAG: site-specific integrase [Clostridiales bacterium]|nr:site-specific integrase [Clostridiales bacterium]
MDIITEIRQSDNNRIRGREGCRDFFHRKELESMTNDGKKRLPPGISLRKDGRYQARYTYNGKRITIYGKDVKELQKKLRDAKYEMEHGIYAKPDRITVDSWYKVWMEEYRKNVVRDSTLISNEKSYKIAGPEIGKMKVQAVRPEHIQRILNKMKRDGYSRGYIESTRQTMNMMFRQALANGIIITNPVEKSVLPKPEDEAPNPRRRALTEWEQKTFLECVAQRKPFYADIFFVGFSTGMRIGEINALEWQDIDFEKLEIHVNGTMIKIAGKDYYKGAVKTGKSKRSIPLLPEIAKRLKRHKAKQAELRLMMGDKWKPAKGLEHLVFTTMFGKPLMTLSIGRYINATVNAVNRIEEKKAKEEHRKPKRMETFCPHAMRHTFATRALEKGIPPRVVQAYLGHATIEMTMNIYTHVTAELEREEIKKLANQF